ncbi:sugar isomerase domain-containing protein [Streptomyces cylindrosporus]|uniref:SIS domain-containing protein n=1 Tax=Streptomyces cylindrosporus TaxID=2927583 RepID=A0ABS9Y385_9ACTN|nr:SIS domain-containing protein [Streptomyces cylindrosporus]MCI3271659.1 SIS domain-containing protein [Streptomyces cylindrosporus]
MSVSSVSAEGFAREGLAVLEDITESARDAVARAAGLIADCVRADGVIQAFGTGHSQAIVLELAGRAGGLVPTNRLSIADLVLYGGDDPSVLDDPLLERKAGVAGRIYDLAEPRPQDLFVIISNSGVNSVVVETALRAKERGHRVLAITSVAHTRAVPAGHESGKKLADLADVVLDNRAPRGDALLELPGGGAVCALSTLTGVMLVQMVVAEASRLLLDAGERPPVYVSANVPGGFEGNLELEKRYAGRIRRTAS